MVVASKSMNFFLSIIINHLLSTSKRGISNVEGYYYPSYSNNWKLLQEFSQITGTTRSRNPLLHQPIRPPVHQIDNNAQSKVEFPIPEDVVMNRSYLPDLGFLTDLAFLFFLPRDVPASGLVRLSRDLFESEQCVQYVSCEMTKVAQRHHSLDWMHNFLQDFPFQGDVAERLRQGSMDAMSKIKKRETTVERNGTSSENNNHRNGGRRRQQEEEICTFSCHPITSLSKGLQILSLLHDLVRTVK